jgi:phosphoenolpyruvate carboxylase
MAGTQEEIKSEWARKVINNESDWRSVQSVVKYRSSQDKLRAKINELKERHRNDSNIKKVLTEVESVIK